MKNCFEFNGQLICLPIYHRKMKFPKDPEPDPREIIFNPKDILVLNSHFTDLIKNGMIEEKVIVNAATLGAIHELSKNLTADLKGNIDDMLKNSLIQLNTKSNLNLKF